MQFRVATCEDHVAGRIATWTVKPGNEFKHFYINDYWGVRRGIAPIFEIQENGNWVGLGTAFSADPWHSMLTAHHILESSSEYPTVAILAHGGVGEYRISSGVIARFSRSDARGFQIDDPLAALQNIERWAAFDVAWIELNPDGYNHSTVACLPIRSRPKPISRGDWVVALGFPGVEVEFDDKWPGSVITEMQFTGAFGRVTELYPEGRGTNKTPVFEVEGFWPGGMSGGPVLDQAGEVVGIVHRGIDPSDSHPGTSWGVLIEQFGIHMLLPTIDVWHPEVRRCWATVVGKRPTQIFRDHDMAIARSAATGEEVRKVRWKLGTRQVADGWDED